VQYLEHFWLPWKLIFPPVSTTTIPYVGTARRKDHCSVSYTCMYIRRRLIRIYLCLLCTLCYSHAVVVSTYVHIWHLYVQSGRLHHNPVLKILLRLSFVSISVFCIPTCTKSLFSIWAPCPPYRTFFDLIVINISTDSSWGQCHNSSQFVCQDTFHLNHLTQHITFCR
jgi:hypothetical protein